MEQKMPGGVMVVVTLYIVSMILAVVGTLLFLAGAFSFESGIAGFFAGAGLVFMPLGYFGFFTWPVIVLGVALGGFVLYGIFNQRSWSRWTVIVLSALGFLGAGFFAMRMLVSGVYSLILPLSLAMHLSMVLYFLLSERVKVYFSK